MRRIKRIAKRRPVLGITTGAVVPILTFALWTIVTGGWVARMWVGIALVAFLLDLYWLGDEWVTEWKREVWRDRLAKRQDHGRAIEPWRPAS